ncbi:hypothetical protein QUB60_02225 [Microcoleus sp. A2-C5]|nr:hypothetical protein [Lyngbya sp. CCAP 1446/10]
MSKNVGVESTMQIVGFSCLSLRSAIAEDRSIEIKRLVFARPT